MRNTSRGYKDTKAGNFFVHYRRGKRGKGGEKKKKRESQAGGKKCPAKNTKKKKKVVAAWKRGNWEKEPAFGLPQSETSS